MTEEEGGRAAAAYGANLRPGGDWGAVKTFYDSGENWLDTMQHIAREGPCWVICSGVALTNSDISADFPNKEALYPAAEEWINPGDSMVVAPREKIVAGPITAFGRFENPLASYGLAIASASTRRGDSY
ncbi:hypothetical protein C7271_12070 [filamentous cyanobacterium CCP5]|nr:hypothetical protein C7271_12070 [filamentous cyanobacterium CCP5]